MNYDFLITSIDRVIYVGEQEYQGGFTRFKSDLTSNELIFHLTSDSVVYFNDTVMETRDNTIRFLPKGKNDRYEVVRHAGSACIDVFFQTDRPISDKAFVINSADNARFVPLFKKIFSVWVSRRDGYYFDAIALLYQIFAEMQKSRYFPLRKFLQIEPAVRYIDEHFMEENISAQTLSELCGISYSYIKKLFVQKFGLSPKKYILRTKLNFAEELLSSGRYRVADVAAMCGYMDTGFFSKQFKLYNGLSPKDYLTKYKSSK